MYRFLRPVDPANPRGETALVEQSDKIKNDAAAIARADAIEAPIVEFDSGVSVRTVREAPSE